MIHFRVIHFSISAHIHAHIGHGQKWRIAKRGNHCFHTWSRRKRSDAHAGAVHRFCNKGKCLVGSWLHNNVIGFCDANLELVDFYPTCTELLGLPTPKSLCGKSLVPLLQDPEAKVRDTALSIHNRAGGGLRSADWHYMKYGENGEELYDMVRDPDQYTNVVSDPTYAAMLKHARAQFQTRMAAAK